MEKERIPQESETIAARRSARLAEKIKKARESWGVRAFWWTTPFFEVILVTFTFSLSLYLVWDLFATTAPDAFFSGPIIPLIAKGIEFFGTPLSFAIQYVNIFFYLSFPITLYLLIRGISGRKSIAFLAVLISSLPVYPFGYVRINSAMVGFDGAHIASLSVVPIALLGVYWFLKDGGGVNLIVASVSSALVALISPFGFTTYMIFALILAFSETLLGRGRLKFIRLIGVLVISAGLVSFWYNPPFFVWMLTGAMGIEIRNTIAKLIPVSFFTLPALGAFGYLLFDRRPNLQPLFLASFFTIAFAMIALAGGGVFPSHPSRYIAELGISLSLLLSVIVVKFTDYIALSKNSLPYNLNKNLVVNSFLTLLFLILSLGSVLSKDKVVARDLKVLGIWEGIDKGQIWQAKDRFSGTYSFLGHAITGVSLLALGFLGAQARVKG